MGQQYPTLRYNMRLLVFPRKSTRRYFLFSDLGIYYAIYLATASKGVLFRKFPCSYGKVSQIPRGMYLLIVLRKRQNARHFGGEALQ